MSRRTLTDIIFHGGDEGLWARSISTACDAVEHRIFSVDLDEEEEDGCGRCAKPRSLRFLQAPVGALFASMGARVPGMLDSLEVQVLCPGLVETKG